MKITKILILLLLPLNLHASYFASFFSYFYKQQPSCIDQHIINFKQQENINLKNITQRVDPKKQQFAEQRHNAAIDAYINTFTEIAKKTNDLQYAEAKADQAWQQAFEQYSKR